MDTTRISIARVLALDVPLTWQDAVAVVQEAAMLSDVHAAMNSHPSLVTPETCFITRTGELELPVTTDVESPDAVTVLLREMLAGRDAPEALEALAFGYATRDMSGALQQFPLPNRRAEIAKLAQRALALQSRPEDAPGPGPVSLPVSTPVAHAPVTHAPVTHTAATHAPATHAPMTHAPRGAAATAAAAAAPAVAPPIAAPPFLYVVPSQPDLTPDMEWPDPELPDEALPGEARTEPGWSDGSWSDVARPEVARAAAGGAASPYVRHAPFRAEVPRPAPKTPPAAPGVSDEAPDDELRRLRSRSVEREQAQRRLSKRLSLALDRFAQWITWRPSSPDPRILGGAVVVTAALVSIVWTDDRPAASVPAPAPSARAAPPRITLTLPELPVPNPAAIAEGKPGMEGIAEAIGALPSFSRTGPRVELDVRGRAAPSADAGLPAAAAPPAERTAAPATAARPGVSAARPGITVTLPAVDPAPGPLVTNGAAEPRPAAPRAAPSDSGGDGGVSVYSDTDDDVAPPVMRRQQLPSAVLEPNADVPDDWPYLELLIDRWGAVEQVRLRAKQPAPGQTLYRHRMLLAAAKAWQFEPARRHGTPVRYLMRVPLEP